MSRSDCLGRQRVDLLDQYWLGELTEAQEGQVDEHLLACDYCAAHLQEIVDLSAGIRAQVTQGTLSGVVSRQFIQRLAAQGLRLREYQVAHNGSVHCTVSADDDVIISTLRAPLAGVTRLDLVLRDQAGQELQRLRDIHFTAESGEIIYIPGIAGIRSLPATTMRMQLYTPGKTSETLVGEYTFIHTPGDRA